MKIIFALLLTCLSAQTYAQDWQAIAKSNNERNFMGSLFQYQNDDINKCVVIDGNEHHILEILIDNNAEKLISYTIDKRPVDYKKSCGDNTILMHAIDAGNLELVKRLIDKGADIKAVNQQGQSGLEYAKAVGNNEIYGYLRRKN